MRHEAGAAEGRVERAEFGRAVEQAVAVQVAAGGAGGGAVEERVAQLRDADRVLLVGQHVGRVPARSGRSTP